MASYTFYPAAIADDGHRTATDYINANNALWWGDTYQGSFIRFLVSSISQGQTIASATLRLRKYTSEYRTGSATIYGVDADDQGQVANYDEAAYDALSLTTASTSLPGANWLGNTWYEWDVTSLVQEIINRGSWAGNAIAIKIEDTDTSAAARWYSYDYSSGLYKPELVITTVETQIWTGMSDGAGAGDTSDGMSCSATAADAAGLGDSSDGTAPKETLSDGIALGDDSDAVSQVGVQTAGAAVGDASDAMSCAALAADTAGLGDALTPTSEYGQIAASDTVGAGEATDGMSLSAEQTDAAGLGDTVAGWSLSEAFTHAADLADAVAGDREAYDAGTEAAAISDAMDGWVYTKWLAQNASKIKTYYQARLFGGLVYTDLVLPIRSFQARLCSGRPSYLSVVVPGLEYAEEIADRNDLVMVVDKIAVQNGVTVLREALAIVYLEGVRTDEGVRSASITLEGHITLTHEQKFLPLQNVQYISMDGGRHTVRCAQPDWFLKPGHYAMYRGSYILIDSISMYVGIEDGAITAWMEVYQ